MQIVQIMEMIDVSIKLNMDWSTFSYRPKGQQLVEQRQNKWFANISIDKEGDIRMKSFFNLAIASRQCAGIIIMEVHSHRV